MNIGQRLRDLRVARGLSQLDMEKRTGLRCSNISQVECGHKKPTLDSLDRWAKGLGLELCHVFNERDGKLVAPKVFRGPRLSPKEKRLLSVFKRLPDGEKDLFLAFMRIALKRGAGRE